MSATHGRVQPDCHREILERAVGIPESVAALGAVVEAARVDRIPLQPLVQVRDRALEVAQAALEPASLDPAARAVRETSDRLAVVGEGARGVPTPRSEGRATLKGGGHSKL